MGRGISPRQDKPRRLNGSPQAAAREFFRRLPIWRKLAGVFGAKQGRCAVAGGPGDFREQKKAFGMEGPRLDGRERAFPRGGRLFLFQKFPRRPEMAGERARRELDCGLRIAVCGLRLVRSV
jgi:hypothetical protein